MTFVMPRSDYMIVDIDGTVSLKGDRDPYDWSRVGEDLPNERVIDVVRALVYHAGRQVLFVTGRMEQCRNQTEMWLSHHVLSPRYWQLFMRKDGDNRADHVMKEEIYETRIRPVYVIDLVIDDRSSVVKMWRSKGLTTLQVADGDF